VKGILHDRWFGWLSLLIVAGYFVVGFWPFDFQTHNQVSWLADRPGLHFEPYGIAYDPARLPAPAPGHPVNFTVELWLAAQREPANDVFDILTIHNPHLPLDFTVCQWQRELLLRATTQPPRPAWPIPELSAGEVLPKQTTRFVTIRGDTTGTDFYVDGSADKHFPRFVVNTEALDGQLILGNGASRKHSWSGWLFGLAFYNRVLEPADIARHEALWTQGHASQLTNAPGLRALYLFDEGHGRQTEDSSGHRQHVIIPAIFQPVHRDLLIPPWKDLSYHHPDYPDIAVNILGFAPFGFCFFLYRRSLRPGQWVANALLAVLAGAAVSLTIEIVQAWLPNRVSSIMDLLTNTTGTLLGVALALAIQRKVDRFDAADHAGGANA
jgi:hypothetical protein